ncbi:MAG: hypothetical protein ACJ72Q_09920 [Nitrososphaeraceae archaeon]|jgi:hypothetical protein
MKTLIYCLDILKIEKDSEFYRDALDLVQKNLIESANESDEWISATKIIAYTYSSLKNNIRDDSSCFFSLSQLSDFLTLSAKGMKTKE